MKTAEFVNNNNTLNIKDNTTFLRLSRTSSSDAIVENCTRYLFILTSNLFDIKGGGRIGKIWKIGYYLNIPNSFIHLMKS